MAFSTFEDWMSVGRMPRQPWILYYSPEVVKAISGLGIWFKILTDL